MKIDKELTKSWWELMFFAGLEGRPCGIMQPSGTMELHRSCPSAAFYSDMRLAFACHLDVGHAGSCYDTQHDVYFEPSEFSYFQRKTIGRLGRIKGELRLVPMTGAGHNAKPPKTFLAQYIFIGQELVGYAFCLQSDDTLGRFRDWHGRMGDIIFSDLSTLREVQVFLRERLSELRPLTREKA